MPTLSRGQRGLTTPAVLLGMLLLLAVTESYVARHDLDFTGTDFWDWRLTGRNAQTNVPGLPGSLLRDQPDPASDLACESSSISPA